MFVRLVAIDIFPHRQPVYGVSVDPDHDGIFLSAGDDGRVLLWDTRMPECRNGFCLIVVVSLLTTFAFV